jgi:integrase/recombinase XerC
MKQTTSLKQISIAQAIHEYLETIRLARSKNTHATYAFAMQAFLEELTRRGVSPEAPATAVAEDAISWFATILKSQSPATEQLYLQAATGFYKFLAAEQLADVNLARVGLLRGQRARRPGIRLPQFPAADIERVLLHVLRDDFPMGASGSEYLRAMRDRAFLLTLADTGLRVHEACGLRRGEIDWNEGRAIVIGKGNKQAVVRFSRRSMKALRDYLRARSSLDGQSGKALASLPLFARHDRGAGSKIKSITTMTGRNIVEQRAREALGQAADGKITPHSFRHYFVTAVLRGSGNLKLAQELARHASVQVTQRYAHLSDDELDKGYLDVFDAGK